MELLIILLIHNQLLHRELSLRSVFARQVLDLLRGWSLESFPFA
jgi:hypothetical protein